MEVTLPPNIGEDQLNIPKKPGSDSSSDGSYRSTKSKGDKVQPRPQTKPLPRLSSEVDRGVDDPPDQPFPQSTQSRPSRSRRFSRAVGQRWSTLRKSIGSLGTRVNRAFTTDRKRASISDWTEFRTRPTFTSYFFSRHTSIHSSSDDRDTWGIYTFFVYLAAMDGMEPVFLIKKIIATPNKTVVAIGQIVCLLCIGYPIMILEMSIGQFSGGNLMSCWNFAPIFRFLGFLITLFIFVYTVSTSVLLGTVLHFSFNCFDIPLTKCNNVWNTKNCIADYVEKTSCGNDFVTQPDGTCRSPVDKDDMIYGVYNYTLVKESNLSLSFPSAEYFRSGFIGKHSNLGKDPTAFNHEILLSLLIYLVIVVCLLWSRMVRTLGFVMCMCFVTKISLMIFFIVHWFTLEQIGTTIASEGLGAGLASFKSSEGGYKWWWASIDIVKELAVSRGRFIYIASYSPFKADIFGRSIGLLALDTFLKVGLVLPGVARIGFIAKKIRSPIDRFDKDWGELDFLFTLFPATELDHDHTKTGLYFIMLFVMTIDHQLIQIRSLLESFSTLVPHCSFPYRTRLISLCLLLLLCALPHCSEAGVTFIPTLNTYTFGIVYVSLVALCEVLAVSYVYGLHRLLHDIQIMVGEKTIHRLIPLRSLRPILAIFWLVVTPLLLLVVFFTNIVFFYTDLGIYGGVLLLVILGLVARALHVRYRGDERRWCARLKDVVQTIPTEWRPCREEDFFVYYNDLSWNEFLPTVKSYFSCRKGHKSRQRNNSDVSMMNDLQQPIILPKPILRASGVDGDSTMQSSNSTVKKKAKFRLPSWASSISSVLTTSSRASTLLNSFPGMEWRSSSVDCTKSVNV